MARRTGSFYQTTQTHCSIKKIQPIFCTYCCFQQPEEKEEKEEEEEEEIVVKRRKTSEKESSKKESKAPAKAEVGQKKAAKPEKRQVIGDGNLVVCEVRQHASAMEWTYDFKACLLTFRIRADNLR